jgi:hypothetical protein
MAEQEEDMKRKRILLTAREKQGIVNYRLERKELTPGIFNKELNKLTATFFVIIGIYAPRALQR